MNVKVNVFSSSRFGLHREKLACANTAANKPHTCRQPKQTSAKAPGEKGPVLLSTPGSTQTCVLYTPARAMPTSGSRTKAKARALISRAAKIRQQDTIPACTIDSVGCAAIHTHARGKKATETHCQPRRDHGRRLRPPPNPPARRGSTPITNLQVLTESKVKVMKLTAVCRPLLLD